MKVIMEVIQHNEQRYDTCGDWQFLEDALHIKVSDTGDVYMNILLMRHEFDEAILCAKNGITDKQVDDWDMTHEETGTDNFSSDIEAPYYFQHCDALASEWQFARLLGVDWREYGKALEKLGWTGKKKLLKTFKPS